MYREWTGASGRWIQVLFTVLCWGVNGVFVLGFFQPNIEGLEVFICCSILVLTGMWWWTFRYFSARTVVLDDRGVLLRHGGERFVAWGDIDEIDNVPGGDAGPGILIHPKAEFFERNHFKKPGLMSLAWTIPSMSFRAWQLNEMLPVLKQGVEAAGGRFGGSVSV